MSEKKEDEIKVLKDNFIYVLEKNGELSEALRRIEGDYNDLLEMRKGGGMSDDKFKERSQHALEIRRHQKTWYFAAGMVTGSLTHLVGVLIFG